MKEIHVISASAGSGKTHRLVDELERALTRAEHPVRPEAVIATTFTKKAAAELRERVRERLLEHGHVGLAQRLASARIGTVHAVCSGLVTEFAFELGLPADLRTLEEDAAHAAFERALASVIDSATDLFDLDERMPGLDWRSHVREIVKQARSNRLDADALCRSAARSTETLLACLPAANVDGEAIADALSRAMTEFVGSVPLDTTKKTRDVRVLCEQALASLRRDGTFAWPDWVRVAKAEPAVKSRDLFEPVRAAASAHDRHPQFRTDLRAAIAGIFGLAAKALEAYRDHKLEWGLIDFEDQERLALDLLGRPHVREILAEQVDLVLVDEFQDTSPLQLELFLALAKLAPRSVWVGDQKQAIFGFRGTDPALMDAAVAAIEARTGAAAIETLGESWRSRAELVRLTSDVFAPAFSAHGIPESRVRLRPAPKTLDPDALGPVVEVWRLAGANKAEVAGALAAAVSELLLDAKVKVRDLVTGAARNPCPADIAVLCPTNSAARAVAAALEAQRVPAVLGRSGLTATPEARVVISALRLWVDGRDAFAAAELGRLVSLPHDPDAWLGQVLDAPGRPFADLAEVARIAAGRAASASAGLLASFDAAVEAVGAREICLRWGAEAQRLANLDQLRARAVRYADLCTTERATATVAGLVDHLASLGDSGPGDDRDEQATPAGQDAVTVSTLHRAKGLEWPVTVLFGFDEGRDPSAFGLHVESERATFSLDDPLGGRWLRYWPDPYVPASSGGRAARSSGSNSALHQAVNSGAEYARVERRSTSERLRLLYVGWTRARDLLVLSSKPGKLLDGGLAILKDAAGVALLSEPGDDGVATWAGRRLEARVRATVATAGSPAPDEPGASYVARGPRDFPSAIVTPSSLSGTGALGRPERIGVATPVTAGDDATALGDACHAFFAADGDDLDEPARVAMAARLLQAFSVEGALRPEALASAGTALREWGGRRWPGATWRREWPLQHRLADGSELRGFADLVLETRDALVLLDHKCLGGSLDEALVTAASYGAQLAAYSEALERATGRSVTSRWLHLPLQGVCVEIR